ncbi:MAG: type IX secretion system sortase PorU [Candidatus Zixiibacteriota bacterium]|nr:MAG: type IX secretion system sortase PorU [candidate division Zixibacteria bacterium]
MSYLPGYSRITVIFASLLIAGNSFADNGFTFDSDVEVLSSDISGVTFKYVVPRPSFDDFEAGNKNYQTLEVPGTAQIRVEGQVLIPEKIVPLGIPPGTKPIIQIIDRRYSESPFKEIAPFFARATKEEYDKAYSSALALNPVVPQADPHILSIDNIRGLNIARIAVPVARYSKVNRALSILESITLRVDFSGQSIPDAAAYKNPGRIFDRIFRNMVANYEIARNWFVSEAREPSMVTSLAASPFDSASTWVRIELTAGGIYKIGWLEFNSININPLGIDPNEVRVFNGGGRELPPDNDVPRPELVEIPITVLGGDDGQFDNGDYIVFYANPVDSWEYSEYHNRFIHYRNHYTDKNIFWLTFDDFFTNPPERFEEVDGSPDGSYDLSVVDFKHRYQKEAEWIFWRSSTTSAIHDYFDWYWGFGRSFETSVQLTDVVSAGDAMVYVRHRSGFPQLIVNNGEVLSTVAFNDSSTYRYSTFLTNDLSDGLNQLEVTSATDFYLDNIEIHYPRWLRAIDGNLKFSRPDADGVIRYNLSGIIGPYILLDITDVMSPVRITGAELSGEDLVFHNVSDSGSHTEFYISTIDRLKSPGSVSIYEPDYLKDIASPDNRADIVLIAFDSFVDQAARLEELRRDEYNLSTRIVKISDIYNQFSWGLQDPVAIRDFLKFAYENWPAPAPSFATLLGDGHYDYRMNLGGTNFNFITPYENSEVMSDEHFVYFGPSGYLDSDTNNVPDMMIGRIPAKSVQDAEEMIDKFYNYDGDPDLSTWRNKIVIVADDNLHPPRSITETYHTTQAETLANSHVPNRFEVSKIYLVEYPLRTGGEKPEAREALIGAFNSGSLIIDWIGHGSPGLWADERIFRRSQDIARLTNARRLPLIYTASCSIGFFDDPSFESFAEELLRSNQRGGVAVISATREVFAGANARLNAKVYDLLLGSDSVGIGEALYTAKYLRYVPTSSNDRSYILLGDPSQILQFPKFDVQFSSAPDSIVALNVGSVAGEIIDNDSNVMSDFNGTAWISVKDGTINRTVVLRDRNNNPINATVSFMAPGPTIFFGPVDVVNGQFTSQFFIPKDVSYGSQGAKIHVYAENGAYDAAGVVDSLLVSGSVPSIVDSTGPSIDLFVDGRPFGAGITMVPETFTLGGEITDEHGINITGQLGHGIVVKIDDGDVYEADVTDDFVYDRGEYTSGTFEISIPSLPLGEHELSIKAWDNFNNSTLITERVEVVSMDGLELSEVWNYPNPVRDGHDKTTFQYCLSNSVERVKISIFTESGRKIKSFDLMSSQYTGMDCSQVDWNLKDADGHDLANGIYLYRIYAESRDTNGHKMKAEEVRKLAILR